VNLLITQSFHVYFTRDRKSDVSARKHTPFVAVGGFHSNGTECLNPCDLILQYDTMPLLFRAQQFWDSDKKATAHNPKAADHGKYRQWAV